MRVRVVGRQARLPSGRRSPDGRAGAGQPAGPIRSRPPAARSSSGWPPSASSARWCTTPTRRTCSFRQANLPPRAGHPLGTDVDGADELGRLMTGGQISLEVGAAAGMLAAVLGSAVGRGRRVPRRRGRRGHDAHRGRRDRDPGHRLAPAADLHLPAVHGDARPGDRRHILAEHGPAGPGRGTDAAGARVRSGSAGSWAARGLRVIVRHIAPNAIGTIVVNVSFQIANAILVLATLSWLGLGVQFPSVDWGDMISAATQTISNGYWWEILVPGVAIIVVIVGLHDARRWPAGCLYRCGIRHRSTFGR